MRENNDRTFAKSRILVGKALETWSYSSRQAPYQNIDLLAINRNVFGTSLEILGRLRKLSDIFGCYRSPTTNLDTFRIKMPRL